MIRRFVCLANSKKEGGRCLAGIELDNMNKPKIEAGHLKWIRPICETQYGEVPEYLVRHINVLDVVEIFVTGYPSAKSYQSENVFFLQKSIQVIGQFSLANIAQLCSKQDLIFGNPGKALTEQEITVLTYSLILLRIDQFKIRETTFDERPKLRLAFTLEEHHYELPVTDVVFFLKYKADPACLKNVKELFVTVSLSIKFKDELYYKLVAAIIPG
jgi:hypothetical protein